jgi:hypothetical protein
MRLTKGQLIKAKEAGRQYKEECDALEKKGERNRVEYEGQWYWTLDNGESWETCFRNSPNGASYCLCTVIDKNLKMLLTNLWKDKNNL